MLSLRIVLLSAPTSLASIMAIGSHHAAAAYIRGAAPNRASGRSALNNPLQKAISYLEQITGHPETKASHSRSACVVTSRVWEETERG
jgi:hypothetical protein